MSNIEKIEQSSNSPDSEKNLEKKKAGKCPRCGEPAMEVDWESGKAKCSKCGYEIGFQK